MTCPDSEAWRQRAEYEESRKVYLERELRAIEVQAQALMGAIRSLVRSSVRS